MATVAKIQLETASGDVGTITISRPRNNLTLTQVNTVFGRFTDAAALRHRSSSGEPYTSVKSAKYVIEENITDD